MAGPLIALAPYVGPAVIAGLGWLGFREYRKNTEAAPAANNARANLGLVVVAGGTIYLTYRVLKGKGVIK